MEWKRKKRNCCGLFDGFRKDDRAHSNIVNKIAASESGTKWIIFVEAKERGFQLAGKLSDRNKDVVFLYSELLHDKKKRDSSIEQFLKELADNERMSCEVLIATKCLDVGVTIKDKNVNIVSFLHDRVDFLQSKSTFYLPRQYF